MDSSLSAILGGVFLALGTTVLYTMLRAQGSRSVANPKIYVIVHRVLGWFFIALFLVMFAFMLQRLKGNGEEITPRINTHMVMAIFLFTLLALKVAIIRFFPKLIKYSIVFGITIYSMSFILIGITGGYYFIMKSSDKPYISHANLDPSIYDEKLGKELFFEKCSTCHMLKDIMTPRTAESWEKVVNDMIALAEPRINRDEGAIILRYLVINRSLTPIRKTDDISIGKSDVMPINKNSSTDPKEIDSVSAIKPDIADIKKNSSDPSKKNSDALLIDKYCSPCHDVSDIRSKQRNRAEWAEIVKRMSQHDPAIVPAEKTDEIVNSLLSYQQKE